MRLLPGDVVRVRGQPRKVCFRARLLEDLQTEVVFVIANRHRVVVQRVHHEHHRVGRLIVFTSVKRFER